MSEPGPILVRYEEPPVPTFEFRVSLTPEEIMARFRDDARIEWSDDPPGSFPLGSERFQGWAAGPAKVVVRHAVRDPKDGASPNVHIAWEPDPRGGTLVRGEFLKRAVPFDFRPMFGVTVVVAVAGVVLAVLIGTIKLAIAGILAALSVYAMKSSRPTAKSMQIYGAPLWALVGEAFVPHALGSADHAPFRDAE